MAIRPGAGPELRLKGQFRFCASHVSAGTIQDTYKIEIKVPEAFPRELPKVKEIGGRIPKELDYHINPRDGTLCLGSPLRLLLIISSEPTLSGFARHCLVPYLYAMSHRLRSGSALPFGELAHGPEGIIDDYQALLGVESPERIAYVLRLLGLKKRTANKFPCPCGCQFRVGRCQFNNRLRNLRKIADRGWFRYEFSRLLEWKPDLRKIACLTRKGSVKGGKN